MSEPVKGGAFLLRPVGGAPICIPEDLPDELIQLRNTTRDFVDGEVLSADADIESQKPGAMPTLLKKAGELGLLMVEVPEKYNGLGIGKIAATVVAESIAGQGSFTAALLCHTGIATLPLLYYGTDAQKQKYLTKLATGEMLGSYALTEANSGSDALAARTKAVLSPDGKHYILNGEKMFITNGGFADLYTVFAKIDGEHFSAFLVERTMQGVSHGPEEKKLGMHGSSTVPLILQDAKVPVENLLGEKGRGHKIAFNTLNVGRWKLAAATSGAAKRLTKIVTTYTKERQQFGKSLSDFELTKQKLAEFAIQAFLSESVVYRYAGDLDQLNEAVDMSQSDAYVQRANITEEIAIESSICKVFCSEVLQGLTDEAVQMFGGYGYLRDYAPERYYRDNRINRIWEGTNEINRLLIPGTLLKRMAKGTLNLLDEVTTVVDELRSGFPKVSENAPLAPWQDQVNQLKKLAVYLGGVAVNKYGPDIQEKQQILSEMADLVIAAYVADSAMSRILQIWDTNPKRAQEFGDLLKCYLARRLPQLKVQTAQCLANIAGGDNDAFTPYSKGLARFFPYQSFDLATERNAIADKVVEAGGIWWEKP